MTKSDQDKGLTQSISIFKDLNAHAPPKFKKSYEKEIPHKSKLLARSSLLNLGMDAQRINELYGLFHIYTDGLQTRVNHCVRGISQRDQRQQVLLAFWKVYCDLVDHRQIVTDSTDEESDSGESVESQTPQILPKIRSSIQVQESRVPQGHSASMICRRPLGSIVGTRRANQSLGPLLTDRTAAQKVPRTSLFEINQNQPTVILKHALEKKSQENQELTQEVERLQAESLAQRAEIEQFREDQQASETQILEINQAQSLLTHQNLELKADIVNLRDQLDSSTQGLKDLEEELKIRLGDLAIAKTDRLKLSQELSEQVEDIQKLQEKLAEAESALKRKTQDIRSLEAENEDGREREDQLYHQCTNLTQECRKIGEELEVLHSLNLQRMEGTREVSGQTEPPLVAVQGSQSSQTILSSDYYEKVAEMTSDQTTLQSTNQQLLRDLDQAKAGYQRLLLTLSLEQVAESRRLAERHDELVQ